MLGSFQIVKVAQEYKFFGQSLDQPEKRSMNVDELEVSLLHAPQLYKSINSQSNVIVAELSSYLTNGSLIV